MANEKENVNPEPKIEGELPEPQISGTPAGQALAQAGDSSVTLEAVEQLLDKKFQSMKDTRLGKMEAKLTDMESAFAEVQKLTSGGMPNDEAQAKVLGEKRLQDVESELQAWKTGKEVSGVSAGVDAQGWKERRASILSDAKIEGSDPRFIEFMKQSFTSHDDMNEKLFEITEEWSFADETKPVPSASTVAQIIPSIPAGDGSYTTEKYVEAIIAARGNKGKLSEIRAKAKADGLEIDRITINL